MQDTILEDIDRIEVIRGPATAVWGGNAMNGVINIITKTAKETQGGLLTASVGNEVEKQVGLRYGDKLGEDLFYRFYAKTKRQDSTANVTDNDDSYDENKLHQMGFKAEWDFSERNQFALQGDIYRGDIEQRQPIADFATAPALRVVDRESAVTGFNLLGRWTHQLSTTSSWTLQSYFDRAKRDDMVTTDLKIDTLDIDFKHQFTFADRHQIIWGMGFRRIQDELLAKQVAAFDPPRLRTHRYNAFIQDEISIIPGKFSVIVGSQFEHNDFSGDEVQPNLRLKWNIDNESLAWASVSKGLAIADRGTEDARADVAVIPGAMPTLIAFIGSEDHKPEEVLAYELGYRTFWGKDNLFDVALFYNDYSNLRTNVNGVRFLETTPAPAHYVQPLNGKFDMDAKSYGLEIAAEWHVNQDLTLKGHYSYFELDTTVPSSSTAINPEADEGLSPQHQASLQSLYQVSDTVTFDTWLRYVDALPESGVNHYTNLDIKITWQATQNLALSMVGQNLLEGARLEYQDSILSSPPAQVERGFYMNALLEF